MGVVRMAPPARALSALGQGTQAAACGGPSAVCLTSSLAPDHHRYSGGRKGLPGQHRGRHLLPDGTILRDVRAGGRERRRATHGTRRLGTQHYRRPTATARG
jgi:hypothetical protein